MLLTCSRGIQTIGVSMTSPLVIYTYSLVKFAIGLVRQMPELVRKCLMTACCMAIIVSSKQMCILCRHYTQSPSYKYAQNINCPVTVVDIYSDPVPETYYPGESTIPSPHGMLL